MAEIVGVAAGTLEIVARLSKVLQQSTRFDIEDRRLADLLDELSIFRNMLAESALMMEDLRGKPPASAEIALRRCAGLASEVSAITAKILDNDTPRIAKAITARKWDDRLHSLMESFKSAVLLFRGIATDAKTHELLRLIYDTSVEGSNTTTPLLSRAASISVSVSSQPSRDDRQSPHEKRGPSNTTQNGYSKMPEEQLSLFDATISLVIDEEIGCEEGKDLSSACVCGRRKVGKWFTVRGKFDTGASANFVSDSIIERAGLQSAVRDALEPDEISMLGIKVPLDKVVKLNWQLVDREVSWTEEFWVAPNANEFDLIIGDPWMRENGYATLMEEGKIRRKRRSGFFGFLNLRLGRKSTAQKVREKDSATQGRNKALQALKPPGPSPLSTVSLSQTDASNNTNAGSTGDANSPPLISTATSQSTTLSNIATPSSMPTDCVGAPSTALVGSTIGSSSDPMLGRTTSSPQPD